MEKLSCILLFRLDFNTTSVTPPWKITREYFLLQFSTIYQLLQTQTKVSVTLETKVSHSAANTKRNALEKIDKKKTALYKCVSFWQQTVFSQLKSRHANENVKCSRVEFKDKQTQKSRSVRAALHGSPNTLQLYSPRNSSAQATHTTRASCPFAEYKQERERERAEIYFHKK
jgi:hypothetical protein